MVAAYTLSHVPTTFAEAAAGLAELSCPACGDPIICLWGCGWDYDRLVCSHYNCDWEHEYDTTTMAEGARSKKYPRARRTPFPHVSICANFLQKKGLGQIT